MFYLRDQFGIIDIVHQVMNDRCRVRRLSPDPTAGRNHKDILHRERCIPGHAQVNVDIILAGHKYLVVSIERHQIEAETAQGAPHGVKGEAAVHQLDTVVQQVVHSSAAPYQRLVIFFGQFRLQHYVIVDTFEADVNRC